MAYKPHPIDTSEIKLSEDILELTELLALNTHEIWAQQRLSENWRYGAQRDDARREHPGLVSYEELSEVEKQYDRNTALETLKTILSLGYRIEPPAERVADGDADALAAASGNTQAVLETLKQPDALDLNQLLALWQARDPMRWARRHELYRRLAERLIKLGEMLLAYDVVSEGLKHRPSDLRLRQLRAHALSRLGATTRANELLLALYNEGQRDEETVGMLARTHKDLWQGATDEDERERQLQQAYEFYEEAYRLSGGYWTGINAATVSLLSGRTEHARELAAEVRAACLADLKRIEAEGGDRYWLLATLGEAALVSENWTEAARWYDEAAATGRRRLGELTSTRRNARLIIQHLGGDPDFVERHLPAPAVVMLAGGDASATRPATREEEGLTRNAFLERLTKLNAGVGYAAVPSEGDAQFLEAMMAAGGETHAVLPCRLDELLQMERAAAGEGQTQGAQSGEGDEKGGAQGDVEGKAEGGSRYERLLRRVTGIVTASEQHMTEGGMSEEYSRLLLRGLASMRATQLDSALVPFALSEDGAPRVVAAGEQPAATGEVAASAPDAGGEKNFNARLVALLFADAVNFSKLTEPQIPMFVRHFLGAVGALVADFEPAPLLRNTWGDGLYLVFENVQAAGRFALNLSDLLNATDWTQHNLPAELNLRIALHAGPVYACTDPVTQALNFIGTHVSRAARLEPITPPGQVYASQAFAALATAQGISDFTCDYVGQTPLAKKYGTFPTYHVRRLQTK